MECIMKPQLGPLQPETMHFTYRIKLLIKLKVNILLSFLIIFNLLSQISVLDPLNSILILSQIILQEVIQIIKITVIFAVQSLIWFKICINQFCQVILKQINYNYMKHICSSILSVAPHIKEALNNHRPVVALESTIISHGMPYPQNKQCAFSIENEVRKFGAIPATIAVLDGKIKVGLTQNQIQRLAFEGTKVKKVSRRDLPYILMTKQSGATTVSSTMIVAQMAGIYIFVTGGIGGVHRGYQHTLDASADLRQLGQTPVTVVSAGVKSILDIPRTLQYLQTQGVPVITYKSQYFPAFFSTSSGIRSPSTLNTTLDIAKLLFQKEKLNLRNGVLVAVPNPNPAQGQMIEKAIQQALGEAYEQGVKGAQITPFLLKRVNQLTQGRSLASNISLVHNNAQIGSKIAVELSELKLQSRKRFESITSKDAMLKSQMKNEQDSNNIFFKGKDHSQKKQVKSRVIVIGASAIDSEYRPLKGEKIQLYKSCRGFSTKHMGGVARNIAQVCARLDTPTTLITPLGNDQYSKMIHKFCTDLGIQMKQLYCPQNNTAQYLTVLDAQNDEMIGISEMEINTQLTFDNIYNIYFKQQIKENKINPNDIVIIDANVNNDEVDVQHLKKLLRFLDEQGYYVIYECKGKKTKKIADPQLLKYVSLLRMNAAQQDQLFKILAQRNINVEKSNPEKYLSKIIGTQKKPNIIQELSDVKSVITNKSQQIKLVLKNGQKELVKVRACAKIAKTTGAGDTLTGTIVSMLSKGKHIRQALRYGMQASRLSVQTTNQQSVISNQVSLQKLEQMLKSQV